MYSLRMLLSGCGPAGTTLLTRSLLGILVISKHVNTSGILRVENSQTEFAFVFKVAWEVLTF